MGFTTGGSSSTPIFKEIASVNITSNCDSVSIENVNLANDEIYFFTILWYPNTTGLTNMYLYVNDDTEATNYLRQNFSASGSSVGGNRSGDAQIARCDDGGYSLVQGVLTLCNNYPIAISTSGRAATESGMCRMGHYWCRKVAGNVTKITFSAKFKAGSRIWLYSKK